MRHERFDGQEVIFKRRRGPRINGLAASIALKSTLIYAFFSSPFVIQLAALRNAIPNLPLLDSTYAWSDGVGALGLSISGVFFLLARPIDGRITSKSLKTWSARVAAEHSLDNRQVRTLRKLSEAEVQIIHTYTHIGLALAVAGVLVEGISWLFLLLIALWTIPIGILRTRGSREYFERYFEVANTSSNPRNDSGANLVLDWLTQKESNSVRELATLAPLVVGAIVLPILFAGTVEPVDVVLTVALTGLVTSHSVRLGPVISSRGYLFERYIRGFPGG